MVRPPSQRPSSSSCLFRFALILTITWPLAWAAAYSGGSGTQVDPYRIATKQDLLDLAATPADYNKHFLMTADIDLAGEVFTNALIAPDTDAGSYGYQGTRFTGTLDGDGHTISNLSVDTGGAHDYHLGLIGFAQGSTCRIENLNMTDATVNGGEWSQVAGVVCGETAGGVTISNCTATGTVQASTRSGGICGQLSGTMTGCRFNGTVKVGANSGALCGKNTGGSIIECVGTGTVSGNSDVGGLCGRSEGGIISKCHADVAVDGTRYNIGGVCGTIKGGQITDCYGTGTVTFSGTELPNRTGGICGNVYDEGEIRRCYSTAVITTWSSGGTTLGAICGSIDRGNDGTVADCYFHIWAGPPNYGLPLTAEEMQDAASYAGFDFAGTNADGTQDTWSISSGHLPRLTWEIGDGPLPPSQGPPDTTLAGMGTQASPFVIASHADFEEFRTNAALIAGFYLLETDLDLGARGIFDASVVNRAFGGTFDGNGHMVQNLTIETTAARDGATGLFSSITGIVRDLTIRNASVTDGGAQDDTGILCGVNSGRLERCNVQGAVAGPGLSSPAQEQDYGIGGLCGTNQHGFVSGCESDVIVRAQDSGGGLCGINWGIVTTGTVQSNVSGGEGAMRLGGAVGHNSGRIKACTVTTEVRGAQKVGGLCGENWGDLDHNRTDVLVAAYGVAEYVGGLIGYNLGPVSECSSSGEVRGAQSVGGLCGLDSGNTVDCHSAAKVIGENAGRSIGGLCGTSWSAPERCYATGEVSGNDRVGGLYGAGYGASNCYATGNVTGGSNSQKVGGLAGHHGWGEIINCYSTGIVSAGGESSFLGGLCGQNEGGTVTNSFWDTETSGINTSDGGTGLTTTQMQTQTTFTDAGWDFAGEDANGTEDIWDMLVYPVFAKTIASFDFDLGVGWHMVSFPVEPTPDVVNAMFSGSRGEDRDASGPGHSIWGWNGRSYVGADSITIGTGYVIFLDSPVSVSGKGMRTSQPLLPLRAGWNLIAVTSSFPFSSGSTTADLPWQLVDMTFEQDESRTDLLPAEAYWIRAETDVDVVPDN